MLTPCHREFHRQELHALKSGIQLEGFMKKVKASQINFSKCPKPQPSPFRCSLQLLSTSGLVEPGWVGCLPLWQYFLFKGQLPWLYNFVQGVGAFVIDQAVLKDNKHKNYKLKLRKTLSNSQLKVGKKECFPQWKCVAFLNHLTARGSLHLKAFIKFGQNSPSPSEHVENRRTVDG